MPRLIAEWEPQRSILLAWPHEGTDWVPWLPEVQHCYQSLIQALLRHGLDIWLLAPDAAAADIRQRLGHHPGLQVLDIPYNDTWIRDYGPLSVAGAVPRSPELHDFRFNAWGGKFPAEQDDAVCQRLSRRQPAVFAPMIHESWFLEGGAVETDGQGTLLATRSSVLSASRNAGMDQSEIEHRLHHSLGLEHFLWLNHGALAGDDTDGHIDTLARFVDASTLIYQQCLDANHPDHAELSRMEQELRQLRTRHGTPYELIPLPHPAPLFDADGEPVPPSYANFLIANQAIFAPVYGMDEDEQALRRLGEAFPACQIVPIQCRSLIQQHGSLHCATMQIAAGVPA